MKNYLLSPPLLKKLSFIETLYMYLSVSKTTISSVFVLEEVRKHFLVYYLSNVLLDAEPRYTRFEQLAQALIETIKKLKHYFPSHTMVVLTFYPLRAILHAPDSLGKLMKWSMVL